MRLRPFPSHWFQDGSLLRLFRHCIALIAGDVAANALSVVSLALTARALGAEKLGVLVLVQTYTSVVDELVTFQSWKALIRFGAGHVHGGERARLAGLLKIGFLLDLASALVATLLAVAGSFLLARWRGLDELTTRMLWLNSLGILCNLAGMPTAVLRLFERFRLFSAQKTAAAAIRLFGVLLATWAGAGLWGFFLAALAATVAGRLLLFAFGLQVLRRNGLAGFLRARARDWREVARFAVWTNLVTTVSLPIAHFDMALVGALVSLESVGVYRIIKQIALVMTMVSDSVYQVIYPRLAALLARNDLAAALQQARRAGALLLAFTSTAALGVVVLAPAVVPWLFGASFARDFLSLDAYMALRAVSCAFVVVHPLFLAMGYVKRELLILIVANTLYLGLAYALGSAFGLLGIVLAYGVQFSSVLVPKILTIRSALRRSPAPLGERVV
jgi:O-antigen/teichoic acid export membrane protein